MLDAESPSDLALPLPVADEREKGDHIGLPRPAPVGVGGKISKEKSSAGKKRAQEVLTRRRHGSRMSGEGVEGGGVRWLGLS